jgi:hypothetical protein
MPLLWIQFNGTRGVDERSLRIHSPPPQHKHQLTCSGMHASLPVTGVPLLVYVAAVESGMGAGANKAFGVMVMCSVGCASHVDKLLAASNKAHIRRPDPVTEWCKKAGNRLALGITLGDPRNDPCAEDPAFLVREPERYFYPLGNKFFSTLQIWVKEDPGSPYLPLNGLHPSLSLALMCWESGASGDLLTECVASYLENMQRSGGEDTGAPSHTRGK